MIANRLGATILAVSIAAPMGLVAFGQSPGNGMGMPAQQPLQSPASPMGPPGVYPGTTPARQTSGDPGFVSEVLQGLDAEVQLAELAQQKSQSADIKQFGQKMLSDHSRMNDKWVKPTASRLGIPEPKSFSRKDKKLIAKLEGLSGSDFDSEYIKAMVKNHQDELRQFETEARTAQDPGVKQIAQMGAGMISQRLEMIEQIAKNHDVPIQSKEILSTR